MKYEYKPESELNQSANDLTPGIADFEVKDAVEEISQNKQTPMIKLTLRVWDSAGKEANLTDRLLATLQWKINDFAHSIGAPELYSPEGEISPAECIGRAGKLKLRKSKNEKYSGRIEVATYMLPDKKPEAQVHDKSEIEDDDAPF